MQHQPTIDHLTIDQPSPAAPPADTRAGDLEYDLAHEGEAACRLATAAPWQEPVQPRITAVDPGGDYGYDLAHDVPGR